MKEAAVFKNVIVPLDGSEFAEAAIGPATTLARQFGATVVFVTVSPAAGYGRRSDYLDAVAARCRQPAETHVLLDGPPATEIMDEVVRRAPALICMTSHGRGPLGQWFLGSVTSEIVREWVPPIVVVGPRCGDVSGSYDEIVVPLDGSSLAMEVIPDATEWAKALHAKVEVVEVVEANALEQAYAAGVPTSDIVEASLVGRVADDLERDGVSATWEVLHGQDPAYAIALHLHEHPTAIVAMTTRGRSGAGLVASGSVATRVIHEGSCPVLLLRPGG